MQRFSENADAARRVAHCTTHWNSFYNLQTQLTLGATDTGQFGLRVFARAAPASPVPRPAHGTSSHTPAATAAGRGSRTPALTGGGPGAEGGLSAHVRASVPKQSWPASLRHRWPPLTLPRPDSSPADVPPAKRFNAASPGSAVGRDSRARRGGPGGAALAVESAIAYISESATFSVLTELIPRPHPPTFFPLPSRRGTPGWTGRAGAASRRTPFPVTIAPGLGPALSGDLAQSGRPPVAKALPRHSPRSGTGVPRGRGVPGGAAAASAGASAPPNCGRRRRARREQLTAAPPPPRPAPPPPCSQWAGRGGPGARLRRGGASPLRPGPGAAARARCLSALSGTRRSHLGMLPQLGRQPQPGLSRSRAGLALNLMGVPLRVVDFQQNFDFSALNGLESSS